MRTVSRATALALAVLAATGCRAAPPAAPPAVVAPPASAPPVELEEALLADAGETFALRVPTAQEPERHLGFALADMGALVGLDVFDPAVLAALDPDTSRQIVMSWGSVDPTAFHKWLASPHPPQPGDGFAIRFRVTVPLRDGASAAAALERLPIGHDCARPGDPAKWSAFLAGLSADADRRAAAQPGNAFVCARDQSGATIARVDVGRRELHLDSAIGSGGLVAAVVAPPRLASASVVARLRSGGFFDARVAVFATPGAAARYRAAMLLFRLTAGLEGVDAEIRPRLWTKGADEVGSFERLVNSPPVLFDDLLMKDMATSWSLTDEGLRAFASLAGREMVGADEARAELARTLHPGGAFVDARTLLDTAHEASNGEKLFDFFLWPHVAALSATLPPEKRQLAMTLATLPFGGVFFELDQPRRRLNLHM